MLKKIKIIFLVIITSGIVIFPIYKLLYNNFYPFQVYPNKITYNNFNIYSDTILDKSIYSRIDSVIKTLEQTKYYNSKIQNEIFISKDFGSLVKFKRKSKPAFALFFRQTEYIIFSKTDIKNNIVYNQMKQNNTGSFSSILSHELTHKSLKNHFGMFKMIFVKEWKEEGDCEYIDKESSFGFSKGLKLFMQNKEDDSRSFDYFKYRLYVQYLIDYKKMTFDEILGESFDIEKLESEIRTNIKSGSHIPPKK